MTKFIVLFTGRSGSTYLYKKLDSSEFIHFDDEIINKHRQPDLTDDESCGIIENFYANDSSTRKPLCQAKGFKLSLSHLSTQSVEFLKEVVQAQNIRILSLSRTNKVKQAISSINMWKYLLERFTPEDRSQVIANNRVEGDLPCPKIVIDPDLLISNIKHLESVEQYLFGFLSQTKAFTTQYSLVYETLFKEEIITLRAILDFIGCHDIDPSKLRTTIIKAVPDDLSLIVENSAEIRRKLRTLGVKYVKMFDEGHTLYKPVSKQVQVIPVRKKPSFVKPSHPHNLPKIALDKSTSPMV